MSRKPLSKSLTLASVLLATATAVVACGEPTTITNADPINGISSVTVTGDVGTIPQVEWDGRLNVEEEESEVLVTGDGVEIKDGDEVLTQIWIGNGYTQEEAYDTYSSQAQPVKVNEQTTKPLITALKGQKLGSRVMVAAPAEDAFGEQGNPTLGIANKDTILFIVDLMDIVRAEPEGSETALPAWMPTLIETDGVITGWDFTKAAKPDGELHVLPMITGDGPQVAKDSTIVTRYLGQVFDAEKPFDESYSKPDPAVFNVNNLVEGWQQGLVGMTAGSRVAIVVPPELGYGKAGNKDANITGTDTLYFVLDILATS